jgi:hypothetical protein
VQSVSLRQAGENCLFAGKVGVDRSGRDTYFLSNFAIVGTVEPLAGKQFKGGSLNATLVFLSPFFGNLGHATISPLYKCRSDSATGGRIAIFARNAKIAKIGKPKLYFDRNFGGFDDFQSWQLRRLWQFWQFTG